MKLKELLFLAGLPAEGIDDNIDITAICNDSRKAVKGCLFVAIPGFAEDGAVYARDAAAKGAVAVVAEKVITLPVPGVVVSDARLALSALSAAFYGFPTRELRVIGVTGTNGKTTTTYLIRHIITHATGKGCGLIGTNEIIAGGEAKTASRTTPESVELQELFKKMLDAGDSFAVMEVSSHALKLARVEDVAFEIGVFSNLTQDHLDFHITMEDYLAAKAHLFELCKVGVLNADDPASEEIIAASGCTHLLYSTERRDVYLFAENAVLSSNGIAFDAVTANERVPVKLAIPGAFSVYNALAALSCCMRLGISLEKAAAALADFGGVKGRAETVPTGREFAVVIDYAHSPDALENILRALRGSTQGRLITVFGCGGDRDRTKRPIMGGIAERMSDISIVTTDNPRTEEPERIIADILEGMAYPDRYEVVTDRIEAIHRALEIAKAGDVVLLAGKGQETYQEINGVKHHMDEREIVRDYLF